MNMNYLYIDEKSLSYNELLKKFVLNNEDDDEENISRDRSNTNVRHYSREEKSVKIERDNEKEKDHYYNVLLIILYL